MTSPTTIRVQLSGALHLWCGGASKLDLPATSVRALLDALETLHPDLHRAVCDETGAVRRHVNLFVNRTHLRDREGLDTPLAPGDVLTIFPAVSGG